MTKYTEYDGSYYYFNKYLYYRSKHPGLNILGRTHLNKDMFYLK